MLMTAEGLSPASERLSPNVYKLLKAGAAQTFPPVNNKTESAANVIRILMINLLPASCGLMEPGPTIESASLPCPLILMTFCSRAGINRGPVSETRSEYQPQWLALRYATRFHAHIHLLPWPPLWIYQRRSLPHHANNPWRASNCGRACRAGPEPFRRFHCLQISSILRYRR